MVIIFAWFSYTRSRDIDLECVSEGINNGLAQEAYYALGHSRLEMVSFIGNTFDECWNALDAFTLIPR